MKSTIYDALVVLRDELQVMTDADKANDTDYADGFEAAIDTIAELVD